MGRENSGAHQREGHIRGFPSLLRAVRVPMFPSPVKQGSFKKGWDKPGIADEGRRQDWPPMQKRFRLVLFSVNHVNAIEEHLLLSSVTLVGNASQDR